MEPRVVIFCLDVAGRKNSKIEGQYIGRVRMIEGNSGETMMEKRVY